MNVPSSLSAESQPISPPGRSYSVRQDFWIYAAALLAFGLKLCIAFKTVGTNDVGSFYTFARALHEHGVEWTYTHLVAFNHPPLIAYALRALYAVEVPSLYQNGFTFAFFIRVPGIIADLVVVGALTHFRRDLLLPSWSLLLFALSPVSLMVSGFHGNTDPVMVMFLVLAACMCVRSKPVLCGLLLALSCQIKVIPLLLFPIFAFFWFSRRKLMFFLLPFTGMSLLFWLLPLIKFPGLMVHNVLAYGSFWGLWGVSYWLRFTGWREFGVISYHNLPPAETLVSTLLKILIVGAVLLLAWRRRGVDGRGLFESIGYAWLVFFIFSPGIAPQYMVWLVPFILVLSPVASIYLLVSSSLFLFFFYNTIAAGLPWYRAVSTNSLADKWSPWTIWPWVTLIVIAIVFWRDAVRQNSSARLLALEPVRRPSGS